MRENDYFKKIDTYREEMIADLQQLIRRREHASAFRRKGLLSAGGWRKLMLL